MKLNRFFTRWKFLLFIISFILFSLPPFYFLPIRNIFFQTHSMAKYIFLLLFLHLLFYSYENLKKKRKKQPILLIVFILIYFFSQSTSVFHAYNIVDFLRIYQYIIFGLMAFFISLHLFELKKNLLVFLNAIIIIVLLHIVYESTIYFFPKIFLFLKVFLYEKYWENISMEINRGKFFLDIYDSIFIPFFVYLYVQTKKTFIKINLILLISAIIFFSFLSNFRIPFLLSLFSLGFSLIYFSKKIGNNIWIFIAFVFISCIFAYNIANTKVGYNIVQRFISSPEKAGFSSAGDIISRSYLWNKALEFGLSSPIAGIGLGNFYDYMPQNKNPGISLFNWRNDLIKSASQHPHNIFLQTFAESGFFGLISFAGLIILFIIRDFFVLKKEPNILGVFIISFWSLFTFGLFHSAFSPPYFAIFYLLRASIETDT